MTDEQCNERKMIDYNKPKIVPKCEHESDGSVYDMKGSHCCYSPALPRTPYQFKCKKCGEFYR